MHYYAAAYARSGLSSRDVALRPGGYAFSGVDHLKPYGHVRPSESHTTRCSSGVGRARRILNITGTSLPLIGNPPHGDQPPLPGCQH